MWRFGNAVWWSTIGWTAFRYFLAAFFAVKAAKLALWLGLPSIRVTPYALDLARIVVFAAAFVLIERTLAFAWKDEAPRKAGL